MRDTPRKSFRTFLTVLAAGVVGVAIASTAQANTFFDSPLAAPGVYTGSGNPNTNFTGTLQDGIEIGLGVQYRVTGPQVQPENNNSNVYHVNTGLYTTPGDAHCTNICALWNVEFSINLRADGADQSSRVLSGGSATLNIQNVGNGNSLLLPISLLDNDRWGGAGAGSKNPSDPSNDWGLQNSENLAFFGLPLGFDPLADDTYIFTLTLLNGSTPFSSAQAIVVAGNGAATPIPAALPLFAGGLGVFGLIARRRKNKNKAEGALA